MDTIETIKRINNFLDAPISTIGSWLGEKVCGSIVSIVDNSYWVLLAFSMCSLFLYVAGQKGAKKYTTSPPLIYLLLQLFKMSL